MIVTDLEHLPQQINFSGAIQKSIAFLRDPGSAGLPTGRVDIGGKAVYALIQAYDTLPQTPEIKFEAHRQYIDIQYIISGEEVMGWAALEAVPAMTPYDAEKDVSYGMLPASAMTPVRMSAGLAAVFFPEDAHAPKLAVSAPVAVKKIVIKVAIEAMRGSA
jgi:YhcH/YjgK/YiaL family protein